MSARGGRTVILGASGFLGRALQHELEAEGADVIGHSSKSLDLLRAETVERELARLAGPETTLILVSALTPDKGQNYTTLSANLTMAGNVAQALGQHPVGRCVYLSSDAVYGFDVNPVTETTPVAPGGWYALGKYGGEKILEYTAQPQGIPLLILRVAAVFGPGDPHGGYGPNAFARSLARDRAVRVFGAGEEERDHIYVDDVARIAAALLRGSETGVVNVATGTSRSFADVVAAIRGLVPYAVETASAPRRGAITHRHYDTARLQRALPGFRFTPFEEGLRATLAGFGAL